MSGGRLLDLDIPVRGVHREVFSLPEEPGLSFAVVQATRRSSFGTGTFGYEILDAGGKVCGSYHSGGSASHVPDSPYRALEVIRQTYKERLLIRR